MFSQFSMVYYEISMFTRLLQIQFRLVGDLKSLAQCKSVVSDILGEIEFCIDIEITYKNTKFKLYTKSQLKLMTILEQK